MMWTAVGPPLLALTWMVFLVWLAAPDQINEVLFAVFMYCLVGTVLYRLL
jgi:hypothetical protein